MWVQQCHTHINYPGVITIFVGDTFGIHTGPPETGVPGAKDGRIWGSFFHPWLHGVVNMNSFSLFKKNKSQGDYKGIKTGISHFGIWRTSSWRHVRSHCPLCFNDLRLGLFHWILGFQQADRPVFGGLGRLGIATWESTGSSDVSDGKETENRYE